MMIMWVPEKVHDYGAGVCAGCRPDDVVSCACGGSDYERGDPGLC